MSVSIHSETSKDEIETEDVELEEIIWNLMSRSGLISQMKGQISKFIEENGRASVDIKPERADGKILGYIFEYLQWIGMKQTNSVLLSESPVEVDMSIFETRDSGDVNYKPDLYKLFEDHNLTEDEDKGSPTRSHNYSKDEFEDSKLTSVSGHQSVKSSNDDDADNEGTAADNEDREESLDEVRISGAQTFPKANQNIEEEKSIEIPSFTSTPNRSLNNSLDKEDSNNEMLINFNSPITKGVDLPRPHVTLRQKLDLNAISDPFQSPRVPTKGGRLSVGMGANFPPNVSRQSFTEPSSLEEILREDRINEAECDTIDASKPVFMTKIAENSVQEDVIGQVNDKNEVAETKDKEFEETKESLKAPSQHSPVEESTSDFMESLTIEEDTQDESIASDTKGMSSCEHVVSLN